MFSLQQHRVTHLKFMFIYRWVEDKKVADRLIEIWPHMERILRYWESLPKSKRPCTKGYEALKNAVSDSLTTVKLYFFSHVAGLMLPYLTRYQTEKPMVPFLYGDLDNLCRGILEHFIKSDVLSNCKRGVDLVKIDLENTDHYLKKKDLHLGFATTAEIQKLISKDSISQKELSAFKGDATNFLYNTMLKILEKCPMKYIVVRTSYIFDPTVIASQPLDALRVDARKLIQNLVSKKIITAATAETALNEYCSLHQSDLRDNLQLFKGFDKDSSRLDSFYFNDLAIQSSKKSLAHVLK